MLWEDEAGAPRARVEPALWIALAASLVSAAMLAPEWLLAPPQLNDNVLHVALARYAAEHWSDHWPVDHWFPSVAAGFPVFAHYPHLAHLLSAALAWLLAVDAGRVYLGLSALLLAALPLSIFLSARRIGLSAAAAAGAAALYPLLSSKGYYGIGWDSYVWRTHGLSVQLWGTFFLFPALGWGARAIRSGDGRYAAGLFLGACILAHFLLGYVATVSLAVLACLPDRSVPARQRLLRLASLGAVAAAATAYFTVPFLMYRGELLRSRWEPEWKWSSMGWRWVLPRLFRGEIFDGDSLAILSLCAALGLVLAVGATIRSPRRPERWVATCFVLWTVLLFGRPTLGRLVDALPFASGLHMHRFIAGVQAFGLLLAGGGLAALVGWVRRRTRSALAAALVAAGIVAIPAVQRATYMRENTLWARAAKEELAASTDFHALLAELRSLPPGRVHAGFRNTWGKDFQIGDIPVYTHLQAAGFDVVGYLFMAMARPGEWQVRLSYMRPEHLDLYDARYLLAPAGRAVPAGAAVRAERGAFALYEVPTSGYFALGTVAPASAGFASGNLSAKDPWEAAYEIGDRWLQGDDPARHRFLSMKENQPRVVLEGAAGAILHETIAPDRYAATVALPAAADLVLKVTHHPRWQATIDGNAAAALPVFPGFTSVRVPAGRHDVRFTYRPPAWKKALFAMALSMFIGGLIAPLWRRFRSARAVPALLALAILAGCERETDDPAQVIDLLADPRALRVDVAPGSGAEKVLAVPVEERSWDFENDGDRTWKIRGYRGKVHGGASDEIAHGGKRSFCIASTSGPVDADARVNIDVRPGTDYRLEGRVRTFDLEPTTATVYGSLYLGEFSYTRAPRDDFNDPTAWHRELPKLRGSSAGWELLRYDLRTRADTRMLRIGLSLGNWGEASGRVCVDDVRLTEVREKSGFASALGPDGLPLVEQLVSGNELRRAVHAYPSSEYRYALTVPAKARLDFAIGIEDRDIADDGDGVRFEVDIVEDGQSRTLFERQLDAGIPAKQRGWFDVELPLDAYAGRRVELVFRTAASAPGAAATDFRGDVAAWANPVVYAARDSAERRREPNVFVISVDTLRADHLRAYGYDRDTSPAIDAFAADAVLFENAFTTMPRTTPALASMMTGLHPRAHGLITLLHALPAERVTLAERLGELGYATGAVVTHNTARESGLQQGFDSFADHHRIWVNEPRARAEHLVGEAARWVSDHRDRKMFFWLHLWDPHFYYIPPRPYDRWFDPSGAGPVDLYERLRRRAITAGQAHFAPGLDAAQQRQMVALYDGEIRYTDQWVGLFLEHLKELGLYEDALIVFTSDHGESLGEHEYWYEHGEYLYDGTLRIPLIVKFPYNRTKGVRIAGKTMLLDVMPTILGALGAGTDGLAGVDLAFHLDGAREPHPVIHAETDRVFFPENPRRYVDGIAGNWKSIREGRWKLIEIPHPRGDLYELYDVEADPGETTDVYRPGDPEAERLGGALREWLASFEETPALEKPANQVEIDEETAERLRRLGYMNE